MRKLFLIILTGCLAHHLIGQEAIYTGGNGDGHSSESYVQQGSNDTSPFLGGSGDGADQLSFVQSTVTGANIFFGGDGDGYAQESFIQQGVLGQHLFQGGAEDGASFTSFEQDLSPAFSLYYGGAGDGHAFNSYQQASPSGTEFFLGGNGDGAAQSSYAQAEVLGSDIFFGGFGDGHASNSYLQSTPIGVAIYFGGTGDGHDAANYLQSSPLGSDIYVGGLGDGHSEDSYDQEPSGTFGVYTGGEGDGADFNSYAQTDFLDALPIELISFRAVLVDNHVELTWKTATETNNHYFLIERSSDLETWQVRDSIAGAGTSSQPLSYQSIDRNPIQGINYYRLRQVDFDEQFSLSLIQVVSNTGALPAAQLLVFPNPVTDRIQIQVSGFTSEWLWLKIYDTQGRVVYQEQIQLQAGNGLYQLNKPKEMLSGHYVVLMTPKDQQFSEQVLSQHVIVK